MTAEDGESTGTMPDADVVVVGAGAAGLALADRLSGPHGVPGLRVALLQAPPGPHRSPPRTWCFWEDGPGPYEAVVAHAWERLAVVGRDGRAAGGALPDGLRYKMIRSSDYEAFLTDRLAGRPGVRRITATVTAVDDHPGRPVVRARRPDGSRLAAGARWVFDSRPPAVLPRARTLLLQHFHGWFLRTARDAFTPSTPYLMDFRTRQPEHGLSFGYVLPTGPREALVEYTAFSARPLTDEAYDHALRDYTGRVLGLPPDAFQVVGHERGVIPMTDAVLPRACGDSVFRIGAAGGATRPATGYTFAAAVRQTAAIGAALARGDRPVPPPPHTRRHRAMDAVLLRALDTGRVDGAGFFTGLFRRNPLPRLLRFLDGGSLPWEECAVGLTTPVLPMARTAMELPWLRRRDLPLTGHWGPPAQ